MLALGGYARFDTAVCRVLLEGGAALHIWRFAVRPGGEGEDGEGALEQDH